MLAVLEKWQRYMYHLSMTMTTTKSRKDIFDKKESELQTDEAKLEKEYDVTMRMLQSAQEQMDKAIEGEIWWGFRYPVD